MWVSNEYTVLNDKFSRMSDAGDDIQVDAPVEEVAAEAPKGKLSVEDALQVCIPRSILLLHPPHNFP